VAPKIAARSVRVWRVSQDGVRGWRASPYTRPADVFGWPPAIAVPTTVFRTH
jgi:hypothetical protein